MSSQEYDRGAGFASGGRGAGWALPLLIGLGLGALLFGLLPNLRWDYAGQGWMGHAPGAYAPHNQQQAIPRDEVVPARPQARPDGRHALGGAPYAFGPGRHGGILPSLFDPRLLGAAALIGAGVWLLGRRRSGPAAPTTTVSVSTPPVAPAPATEASRREDAEPSTGETRRL